MNILKNRQQKQNGTVRKIFYIKKKKQLREKFIQEKKKQKTEDRKRLFKLPKGCASPLHLHLFNTKFQVFKWNFLR